jgi:hypothetical protein
MQGFSLYIVVVALATVLAQDPSWDHVGNLHIFNGKLIRNFIANYDL